MFVSNGRHPPVVFVLGAVLAVSSSTAKGRGRFGVDHGLIGVILSKGGVLLSVIPTGRIQAPSA